MEGNSFVVLRILAIKNSGIIAGEKCRERWNCLKGRFVRERNTLKKLRSNSLPYVPRFSFYSAMKFVEPFLPDSLQLVFFFVKFSLAILLFIVCIFEKISASLFNAEIIFEHTRQYFLHCREGATYYYFGNIFRTLDYISNTLLTKLIQLDKLHLYPINILFYRLQILFGYLSTKE